MAYVDPKNLGYKPYYWRWVAMRCKGGKDAEKEIYEELFEKYVPKCIDYILEGIIDGEITEKLKQVIPVTNLNMVRQLCAYLDASLTSDYDYDEDRDAFEGVYIMGIYWSLGGSLLAASREKFDVFVKNISGTSLPASLVYDNFYDTKSHQWVRWDTQVKPYIQPEPFNFNEILVPTRDFCMYKDLLQKFASIEKPILFVGESGTAKTVSVQHFLNGLPNDDFMKLNINFSSRTTALDVQKNIEDVTDRRSGKIYGPPVGKKLLVFIDDLNMPKVDLYGTQQPIALLHFLVGNGTMYEREKDLEIRYFKDMMYIGAMGPPGGGRNSVDPRFTALFAVLNLTQPSEEVLKLIYESIITQYTHDFSDGIKQLASTLAPCTLKLYNIVQERLPPTPKKFHYIFNLRDLGRVFEGMCLATPDNFENPNKFIRLWRNECHRIFCDRLIETEDITLVASSIENIIQENYPSTMEHSMKNPLLFGDFEFAVDRITEGAEDPRLYNDVASYEHVRTIFDGVLESFNLDHQPMNLVLFEDALLHLTRIHRIIRMNRGNALLVGVGGSGKQSLTKLAAYTAGYKLFEIKLSRGYGESDFREDIKILYSMLSKEPVVFLFTDAHVVEEGFLELINNMLTTGMVPALFESDEKDAIINGIRKEVKSAGLVETTDNCWNFFVKKCSTNLHIVLAMSPSGNTLRVRCRNFPGFVSATVIDWFFPWPEDALRNVANHFLSEVALPEELRGAIVNHMVLVHLDVVSFANKFLQELRRHYYVTPKNYLDYISNYSKNLKAIKGRIVSSIKRLQGGLTKLMEAATDVDRMSKQLEQKKVIVDAKTQDCEALIKDINEKKAIASKDQAIALKKSTDLEQAAIIIAKEKAKAQGALDEALPALAAAADALDNLDKKDIGEIKNFSNPPTYVRMVCICVLHLKPTGREDESGDLWKNCKVMLNQNNFLECLKTYNKDGIKKSQINKIRRYFKDPEFNSENMKKISTAGYGLMTWLLAIDKYYDVAQNVEPLKIKVMQMEKQQDLSTRELAAINQKLSVLERDISELTKNFKSADGELTSLKEEAELMEARLSSAAKLIVGLSGEQKRWGLDKERLLKEESRIVGDALLASSFLSYAGAFTFDYRANMIYDKWFNDLISRKIPLTEDFKLQKLLTNDAEVQRWVGEGLPQDEHSIQNGMLTTMASRFPLCIDPQQQAVSWIKNKEGKRLRISTFNEDFMRQLEIAVQFGEPFLFEGIDEELDPIIDPILEQNTFMQGQQRMITLGDKTLEWDNNFRLYLTTKLANPHYSPEVMGKTMIVNYSVTVKGLQNQLLNVVVGHERPDLEEQYKKLVEETSSNTQLLLQLEDMLLHELANVEGNILDNQELISTLEKAKQKSVDISKKLEKAKFTTDEINKTRDGYTPAAKRGSILYFAMAGLSIINKMYEVSLSSFLSVFNRSLDAAKKDVVLGNRLRNIISETTSQVYEYTSTGVFEKHKLVFSFQMTCMILDGDGDLNREYLNFFLKGDTSLEGVRRKKPNSWISDGGWKDLLKLSNVDPVFATCVEDLEKNEGVWADWYDLEDPESYPMPMNYDSMMNKMQQLLIIRCYRSDRCYNAAKLFVMENLGEKYVQPPVLDYQRIYSQSTPFSPIVFVLSPGADPQSDIQSLGIEMGFTGNKFKFIALGQGQGPVAESMLEAGMTRGHWVLLQNCHLLES